MTKKDKIAGKLLFKLNLVSNNTRYRILNSKNNTGFAGLGKMLYDKFLVDKNYGWLQDLVKQYEELLSANPKKVVEEKEND